MQLNKHKLSIWTALLNTSDLEWALYKPSMEHLQNPPAPKKASQNNNLWYHYYLKDNDTVNLSVVDMWGKTVCSLFNNRPMKKRATRIYTGPCRQAYSRGGLCL